MVSLALALQLTVASPGLAPPLDPGPFGTRELALASAGALTGDALVFGAAYLTLQLFAVDAVRPSGDNFRRAAYVLGATAVVVPPLTAVLLARLAGEGREGGFWRALLLATAGQAAALAVGYLAAPQLWLVFPVQLAAVSAGTSLGLYWGRRRAALDRAPAHAPPAVEREPPDAGEAPAQVALFVPVCPDA